MKLDAFLKKNKINLSEEIYGLCKEAIEIMRKAEDPSHDESHVYAILDVLDEFMRTKEYREECKKMDLPSLLLAICWHDVWRSTQYPGGIFMFLWNLSWDGMGSARMFKKAAKRVKLDKKTRLTVQYSIRKHSYLQYFPIFGMVAKLLYDLDNYDNFNYQRLQKLKRRVYREVDKLSHTRVVMAKVGLKFVDKFNLDINMTYDWFKRGFAERKKKFVEEVKVVIKDYQTIVEKHKKRKKNVKQTSRKI